MIHPQQSQVLRNSDSRARKDPETNNVLADGVDTSFLRQEIKAGRLEAEAGWDED